MKGLSFSKDKLKKIIPIAFLSVLTILLMIYFKSNRGDFGEIVSKGTNDILSLYTQNLKPLLFGTDITNEDVFNFALYQTIPIDKQENKLLKFTEQNEVISYEVLPSSYKPDTENYQNFVKYMSFDDNQIDQLDSILESYQPELAEAVLTDGNNTLAVNSRLASLQKAVLTDIAAFSQSINRPKISSLFDGNYAFLESRSAFDFVDDIKSDTSKEFLIISNDTAFTSELVFSDKKLQDEISRIRSRNTSTDDFRVSVRNMDHSRVVIPNPPKVDRNKNNEMSFAYTLPNVEWNTQKFNREVMDSLRIALNQINKELANISFNFDVDSLHRSLKFDLEALKNDTLHSMAFEFNFENLGQIVNKSIESALKGQADEEYWERFGAEMDSLANELVKAKKDSVQLTKEELKKRIEQMKRKNK